ncbi:protein cbp-1-like [Paramacrobiotus metropolitanus]|uniref:protein cbp-1-like n=1 Tax=Paramacrobiotus metropolitanus TaxID=2943436 RepID=UPI002445C443|nr:protein cbp-1-like [Paramacrobiotus metropolitanus]
MNSSLPLSPSASHSAEPVLPSLPSDDSGLIAIRSPGSVDDASPPPGATCMNDHVQVWNAWLSVDQNDRVQGGAAKLPPCGGDLWNSALDAFIKGMQQLDLQDAEDDDAGTAPGKRKKRTMQNPELLRVEPTAPQNAPETRWAMVERLLQTLLHVGYCHSDTCSVRACQNIKRLISHTRTCQLKFTEECSLCWPLIALCCYHAKQCNECQCLVPFCQAIRPEWEQQRRGQEEVVENLGGQSLPPPSEGVPAPSRGGQSATAYQQSVEVNSPPNTSTLSTLDGGVPQGTLRETSVVSPANTNTLISFMSSPPTNSPLDNPPQFAPQKGSIKEWHLHGVGPDGQASVDSLRRHIIGKLVFAIFPYKNQSSVADKRMTNLICYARKVEAEMYDQANTREEYCQLMAEKIYQTQKELQEKRRNRQEQIRMRLAGAGGMGGGGLTSAPGMELLVRLRNFMQDIPQLVTGGGKKARTEDRGEGREEQPAQDAVQPR